LTIGAANAHGDIVGSHARAFFKLGRYEILKHLARGGMAEVLLGRTTGIEGFARHVVIKRIHAAQAHDRRYVAMFLDEARLAASLHHHNIVQVNDIGEVDGEYFFAMEYVHGEDTRALLSEVTQHGQLVPIEHAMAIVCAAAAGLHHAHEQRGPDREPLGIVHRDVSPANILIGYDGGVKVADFGIAKATHRTTKTRTGTLKGKVAYMSPEQCVGEAVDRRSDVFSLGIVLYELLTARRLFKAENDFMTMTAIVLGYIPPPSKFRPELPPQLEDIVLRALATKPSDRYATAHELRLALEQLAATLQLSMSSTALADYMHAVFGSRPEPWLDDEEPEPAISIDFDGSLSGVVRVPVEAIPPVDKLREPFRESPRRAPSVIVADEELVEPTPPTRSLGPARDSQIQTAAWPVVDDLTPVVDPLPPTPAPRTPRRSRSRVRVAAGVVAAIGSVLAFAAALWLSRDRGDARALESDLAPPIPHVVPRAAPPIAAPPTPATPEVAAPTAVAPPVTPAPVDTPAPPAAPSPAVAPAPAAKPAVRSRARARKKRWSPDELFILDDPWPETEKPHPTPDAGARSPTSPPPSSRRTSGRVPSG